MLQHHLLIAVRNLRRHTGSFVINLVGLSTGLACALLIYLWVLDEKSVDAFHPSANRLYQVMERSTENDAVLVHEATQGPLAAALARDLPEVETALPVFSLQKEGIYAQLKNGSRAVRGGGIFADKPFFTTFAFPLQQGAPQQALADKKAIVLSDNLARALYGSADAAIGKTVEWEMMGEKKSLQVSGVMGALPSNSAFAFDFALSYEMMMELAPNMKEWWNEGPSTYLLLREGTNIAAFNKKIENFTKRYHKENNFTLFVRPVADAYLFNRYENGQQAGGRIAYVRLFSLVALFIVLIACINFMNLSTARASRRLKEVGIKKVLGSTRKTLVAQFLVEALVTALAALTLACVLAGLLLPLFNALTGKQVEFVLSPSLVLLLLGVGIFTGLFAGSYPAFYLSGFQPITILKGKLRGTVGELLARKGLVVFQFAVSLVLIVGVVVVQRQVDYVQQKNLGYDKANAISFDREGAVLQNTPAFLAELRKQPGVLNASAIQQSIVQAAGEGASTYGVEWPGKPEGMLVDFSVRSVDLGLLETLGIQVKEGRSFSPDYGAENTKIIFNESAIRAMGLQNPVGKTVRMWGEEKQIIGVVKDFHLRSLHEKIEPLLFVYNPKNTASIVAKLQADRQKEALENIAALYKKYNPGYAFDFRFLDEAYQAQYVSESRVSMLARWFAGLAVLISCLGLFGLAAFQAEIRTKEIGIRKVLGASVRSVVLLLSKDFLRLVLLAIVLAVPLAWWALGQWLQGFAYRVSLSPWMFALAALAVVLVALLPLAYQSLRAAWQNPAKSLHTE